MSGALADATIAANTDVTTAVTGANALIAAGTVASTVNVTVNSGVTVTEAGSNQINLDFVGVGKGDGALVFTNNGTIGKYDTTTLAVAETTSVSINGSSKSASGTIVNNGPITGYAQVFGVTGAATVTNNKLILGSGAARALVAWSNGGDATATNAAGAQVLASTISGVEAQSFRIVDVTNTTPSGITTTTYKGGSATAVNDGTAGTADGTTKLSVLALAEVGNATASSNGIAKNVTASAGQSSVKSVSGAEALPIVGETKTTSINQQTFSSTAKATVTIGATGKVDDVAALGAGGGAVVTVDGSVAGSTKAVATLANIDKSTIETKGTLTNYKTVVTNNSDPVGGDVTTTVNAGGTVKFNSDTITNKGTATLTVGGTIGANAVVTSVGSKTTSVTTDEVIDASGGLISNITKSKTVATTAASTGGHAEIKVLTGGKVTGSATATGDGPTSAIITNAGTIGGLASAVSQSVLTTSAVSTSSKSNYLDLGPPVITKTSSDSESTTTSGSDRRRGLGRQRSYWRDRRRRQCPGRDQRDADKRGDRQGRCEYQRLCPLRPDQRAHQVAHQVCQRHHPGVQRIGYAV